MKATILFMLGTMCLCHVMDHVNMQARWKKHLKAVAIVGALLGALGYYGLCYLELKAEVPGWKEVIMYIAEAY